MLPPPLDIVVLISKCGDENQLLRKMLVTDLGELSVAMFGVASLPEVDFRCGKASFVMACMLAGNNIVLLENPDLVNQVFEEEFFPASGSIQKCPCLGAISVLCSTWVLHECSSYRHTGTKNVKPLSNLLPSFQTGQV